MAKFDVLDMNGKKVSTIELSDAVFGLSLIHIYDTYGQYWEILYAAQLNAQRQHLLAAVEAGASGQSEYAALAQQAGSALEELAGRTQYPENRTLIENWAN